MFQVYRNNRLVKSINNQTFWGGFDTYEQARQALRKHIRAAVNKGKLVDNFGFAQSSYLGDKISRNPTRYTHAGFAIKKVA